MKLNFFAPTSLIVGEECVTLSGKQLASVGKRCLIVTGKTSAVKSGAFDDAVKVLDEQNIAYAVYDGISQNPTVSSCKDGGNEAIKFDADFILGIGGGSALDAAKGVAVFASNSDLDEDGLYSYKWENDPLPVVCIGTTAGTGSEVTPVSVLTAENGRKKSIRDDRIYPVLSLGDAKYIESLSESFTRSCAIDAVSHSIESFFSKAANDVSKLFACRSIEMIMPVLKKLCGEGIESIDSDDRETLYIASVYAGYAISITGTAFPHAMGYFLSEEHDVPHGSACAVFLPHFLEYARANVPSMAENFSEKTGYDIDSVIKVIKETAPSVDVKLTKTYIEKLHPRWLKNNGLLRSPGIFSADDANALLVKIFT